MRVLDDLYNANADSMLAALQVLQELPCKGRRVAVLGDMAEPGAHSESAHAGSRSAGGHDGVEQLIAVARCPPRWRRRRGARGRRDRTGGCGSGGHVDQIILKAGDTVLLKASVVAVGTDRQRFEGGRGKAELVRCYFISVRQSGCGGRNGGAVCVAAAFVRYITFQRGRGGDGVPVELVAGPKVIAWLKRLEVRTGVQRSGGSGGRFQKRDACSAKRARRRWAESLIVMVLNLTAILWTQWNPLIGTDFARGAGVDGAWVLRRLREDHQASRAGAPPHEDYGCNLPWRFCGGVFVEIAAR